MGYLSRWAVRKPVIAIIAWFALLIVIGVLGGRFGGDFEGLVRTARNRVPGGPEPAG